MTILRINFAGNIMKAEHKRASDKPLCEVSLCKRHKGRNGAEDTFTWLRVTIWEPAEFQMPKLVKGSFIAGSGDAQLRSYVGKDDTKGTSLECRSTSFDIEVSDGASAPAGPIAHHAQKPVDSQAVRAGSSPADDETPF